MTDIKKGKKKRIVKGQGHSRSNGTRRESAMHNDHGYDGRSYDGYSYDSHVDADTGLHNEKGAGQKFDHFKRKLRHFWRENKFECVSVAILVVAASVALPFIISSVKKTTPPVTSEADVNLDDYGDLFADKDENGNVKKNGSTVTTTNGVRVRVDESTGEEIEDPTVLVEKKGNKSGYLDNCVFIGDSRTVAMVSYGVISDEDVLAKVGISHTAVKNYTFTQNSGKQYTVKSFLQAKSEPVVYIALGVNGMKGAKEEDYEKAFKDLVEYIMELGPDRKIVLMAIWPVDDNGTYKGSVKNEWIDKYNDFLLALAQYEGIYYLDINNILKDKNGSIKKEYDGGDGLHYSAGAYNVIIDYIISHPVPGVSDDGDYVVHYVKPRGEYKDMIKKGDPIVTQAPVEEHVHNYYVSEITKEATCTEPGVRIMACEGCDSIYEEEIPALGHNYGDDGLCKRCGAKNPDYAPAEQQQHVHNYNIEIVEKRKDPTCTSPGEKWMKCECGDEGSEPIVLEALGHDMVDGKCTRCDYTENPPEPEQKQEEPTPEPTQDTSTEQQQSGGEDTGTGTTEQPVENSAPTEGGGEATP